MGTNCKRMKVTAVGVTRHGIVRKTSNGNYTEQGCTGEAGKCGCTHAEINLLELMGNNPPLVVHVSHAPCINCAKALLKAGVQVVFYREEYRLVDGVEYLRNNFVVVKRLDELFL
ncbi:cytidylate deaminase [Bacillus phage YungSlug]|nr:cytidylate deaminase [Bacillus phage YungSlug]